jgi:hypothetical protein
MNNFSETLSLKGTRMSQFKVTRFHTWRVGLLSSFFFIAGHFLLAETAEKILEEA